MRELYEIKDMWQKCKRRKAQAKTTFEKMKSIFCDMCLSVNARKRLLKCDTKPVLLFGSDFWNVNK